MSKSQVRTLLPGQKVQQLMQDLPKILSGEKPDKYGLHKIYWGAVAHRLFLRISQAYLRKSKLQTDDLGEEWEDLAPVTKAYKRQPKEGEAPSNLRRRSKNKSTIGILTPSQDKLWRLIFGQVFHAAMQKTGGDADESRKIAGQVAWAKLKKLGAKTKLKEFGERKVPVMIDTGRLYYSLLPGKFDPQSGYKKYNKDQVFKATKKSVLVGTKVPYSIVAQGGGKSKIPLRLLWAEDIDKWLLDAVEYGRDVLAKRISHIARTKR